MFSFGPVVSVLVPHTHDVYLMGSFSSVAMTRGNDLGCSTTANGKSVPPPHISKHNAGGGQSLSWTGIKYLRIEYEDGRRL
jgi:hypothetical protein